MKQNLPRIAIALLIVLGFLGHAAGYYRIGFIDRMELQIYDWRLNATMPNKLDDRIVILDIDEKSLAEIGHWPWSRDKLARILDKLFDVQKIAIVGFDIVFAERDQSSGLQQLERIAKGPMKDSVEFNAELERLRPTLDYDRQFADAIKGRPVVLGFFLTSDEDGRKIGSLGEPIFPAGAFKGRPIQFRRYDGYSANLPELQKAAVTAGSFSMVPDVDGIVRRVPMLVEQDGKYYDSLSLAMMRTLLGAPTLVADFQGGSKNYGGLESLGIPSKGHLLRVPVDEDVSSLVPYRGHGGVAGGSFRYVSLADVLADRIKPGELKDKIAIMGTTAGGLYDLRATPVDRAYPGVEAHANLLSGMLDGNIKERPEYTIAAEMVMVLVTGLLFALVLPLLSALRAVIATIVVMLIVAGFNILIYTKGNLVLPVASVLIMLLAVFLVNMVYGYFIESRSKRELAGLFGSYVPPELVDEMAKDPTSYSMEGRSEELTVMFSDVRGFTTISETLKPKELSEYINDYLTAMSVIIQRRRGTLDKYIGDAIMAFWGAPVADANHAQSAVETAMEMQHEVGRLNEKFQARGWPDMKIGVGVSTGTMSVGDMGSKIRRAYTVMGDAVNLGSRLESITKIYGVGILVAEATRKVVSGVVFREIDRVRVKGKDEPVAIFEPLGHDGELDARVLDELKLWNQALRLYRSQQWDQCEVMLLNLQRAAPQSKLYHEYAERVVHMRQNPPGESWDGVTTFTTK